MPSSVSALLAERLHVVLVGTMKPGNIGSAARAMKNMGAARLTLVHPQTEITDETLWLAAGAGDVVAAAARTRTLPAALSSDTLVIGTSSSRGRRGELRRSGRRRLLTPRELAEHIAPLLATNRVALVFGPEARGLSNRDLERCNLLCRIPGEPSFPTLNLAQAVMVVLYELRMALEGETAPRVGRKLAAQRSLSPFYAHLRRALESIGFLRDGQPGHIFGDLEALFGRAALDEREVRILRGVCRQVLWISERRES